MSKLILDYTTMSDFLTCRKRHYWRHRRNVTPIQRSLALLFGAALHIGFKVFYTKGNPIEAFKEAYQPEDIPDKEKRTIEHGVMILEKYMEQYRSNPFTVIECNGSHLIRISQDITYACRMDAVIKCQTGHVYVMEHKTTSSLGYYFFDNFTLNHQVDGYVRACKDKYGECEGVLMDAISTKKEVLTDADIIAMPEAKRKYKTCSFLRDIATRTIDQQNNFTKEVLDIAQNIAYAIEKDSFPMNKSMCNYYGACPYKALCLHGEGAMDMYEVSVWDAKEGKERRDEKTRTE